MLETPRLIQDLSNGYREQFQKQRVIQTFGSFLQLLQENPRRLIRNAAEYIRDTFDDGEKRSITPPASKGAIQRFKIFDLNSGRNGPIIGGESVQDDIYKVLQGFCRQGYANKLILLHGPNGSSKSSTIEAIAYAMQRYSETEKGAVYRFNWIFPTDQIAAPLLRNEHGPIGFGNFRQNESDPQSYALLEESQIASKIHSDFKDNPVYLIPMPQREIWLREWIAAKEGKKPEDIEIPPHILMSGLSKRNQLILENLLSAYDGDLEKVFRHVQVERFFYSRQYRVGISTVEPQMAVDAAEKQLTMDRNIQNLPSVLHNIRYYEAQGELIEANRGLLEFSDLLKRPLEAFKYLLTTVEKSNVSLPSSTANLDIVFFATTNDKHLDSFKTIPDFSSFRGRFELITVPYLLRPSLEVQIYDSDVAAIKKVRKVTPHAVELLAVWAVMTRYKQPDPEHYESQYRGLIARLDPRSKARLYEGESLRNSFKPQEEALLKEVRSRIINESIGSVIYEGRFGASPRELKQILHRAAQSPGFDALTPMAIFDELDRLVKDRSVYDFLQFEPRGKYHDVASFIQTVKDEFADIFEIECIRSMAMVADEEYDKLLVRYIENIVADVKKEKIFNPVSEQYEAANQALMQEIEKILGITGSVERHRESLLTRLAAWKIDHKHETLEIPKIFQDILNRVQEHHFNERKVIIQNTFQAMLALDSEEEKSLEEKQQKLAKDTYQELYRRFGYDPYSARECLKFMLKHNKKRRKS